MSDQIDPDSLAERITRSITSAMSRRSGDEGDDYEYQGRGRVPYDRFRQQVDARKSLEAELTELRAQVEQLQTGYQSQLDQIKAETAEQMKTVAQRHQEDIRLVEHGIKDDLGRAALRQAWESQPKDARGKSPAEWWGQQVEALEAHRANPEEAPAVEVPRVLQGYLPSTPAPAPAPSRGGPPRVDAGAAPRRAASVEDRLASLPQDASIQDIMASLRG